MKILFAHDHIFSLGLSGKLYSPGKLSNKSFERYLNLFGEVGIVSRCNFLASENKIEGYNNIDDKRIVFHPFDSQSTFVNRFIKRSVYKLRIKSILEDYDALVVRVPSEIGFLAANVAKELNIPYVCEVVACPVDAMMGFNTWRSKMYLSTIKNVMKRVIDDADGALYVTSEFLQKRYPCRGYTTVASNVEISNISSEFKDFPCGTTIRIALTGNLDSSHKGYPVLYKAFDLLSKKDNFKFKFFLIGAGTKFIEEHLYDNISVEYTGPMKHGALFELLDTCHIYIQPSNQEGLPRATIEAMSRGLPCVVSSAGGLSELIDSSFVHAVGDAKGLADKIDMILSSNIIYSEQSRKNLEKASKFLSDDLKLIRRSFYSKLLKQVHKVHKVHKVHGSDS